MELDRHDRKIVMDAIRLWMKEGKLDSTQAQNLRQSIVPKKSGQQLATYFFVVALACALLSFGALFIDEKFLERFRRYFALSNWSIGLVAAGVATTWFWYVHRRRSLMRPLFAEMHLIGASVISITSLIYVCKETGPGAAYTGLLLLSAGLLAILYTMLKSTVLWIGLMLSIMGWYAAFAYIHSSEQLFLGMNYPVRFAAFGFLLVGLSLIQERIELLKDTWRITLIIAVPIFFTAMWGVSVFGNFSNLEAWAAVRQTQVLIYAIIFGFTAILALYAGVRHDDSFLRDTGIIFLLLNLYTRYFEYFWGALNKGVFFLVIAVSFWLVGKWLTRKHRERANI